MRCVQCGHLEDKVIDSRMSKDGTTIRRRRVCLRCDYRYTTYEQIERTELRVVKRDNLREALNREKILRGLVKACEKRPVSMDRLDRAVEEIISELHRDHLREVPSSEIVPLGGAGNTAFWWNHGAPWPAEAYWRNPSCAASRTSIKNP